MVKQLVKTMTRDAPGLHFRRGTGPVGAVRMFPDDATAEAWFAEVRWPNGPACPGCGSVRVQSGAAHKTMPYRCRERGCRKRFSVRTGTVMQASNLGYRVWAMAIHLFTTDLEPMSSMKLHRELDITQKSAWHLAHRLRKVFDANAGPFSGPAEVDETCMGGRRASMPKARREALTGRGAAGENATLGAKDRAAKRVSAGMAAGIDKETVGDSVSRHANAAAAAHGDDAAVHDSLSNPHESVNRSVQEHVRGDVHRNGIESLWSMFRRARKGILRKLPPKRLDSHVRGFAGKSDPWSPGTLDIMGAAVLGMSGEALEYGTLIAGNGLDSGARGWL